MTGSINSPFLVEDGAQFKPIHHADLTRAVSMGLDRNIAG